MWCKAVSVWQKGRGGERGKLSEEQGVQQPSQETNGKGLGRENIHHLEVLQGKQCI